MSGDILFRNCEDHFKAFGTLPYYRACIFGEKIEVVDNQVKYQSIAQAFYYTPSGLQRFKSTDLAEETQAFCTRITKSFDNHELTGILGDTINNPSGDTYIYALFKKNDGEIVYYRSTMLKTFDMSGDLSWQKIGNPNNTVKTLTLVPWWNDVVGISSSRNLSEAPFYEMMSDLISRYNPSKGTYVKILSFFSFINLS